MTTTPDVPTPTGVAAITEWCDPDHPEEAFRSLTGPRRGTERTYIGGSARGPHYVEAAGSQDSSGQLFDLAVHAQIDLWGMNRYESYDTMLTAEDARDRAAQLRDDAALLTRLADAFELAADDLDGWGNR